MSLKLGTQDISGISQNTKYNAHHLLDFKWTDCIMNDVSWLRADTFSWQSGNVYTSAYNHLVADLQGTTAETETIGSYTVTFYRADDGHKICLADQETTVLNIYNETGIAWYYIIDTTNTQFKLPRTKYGFEGLRNNVGDMIPQDVLLPNITGLFTPTGLASNAYPSGAFYSNASNVTDYSSGVRSGYGVQFGFNASRSSSVYSGNGSNTNIQQKATQMYLYFYVGDYTQTAIEQTAGINTDLFSGKADVDGVNATFAHIIDTYINGTSGYIIYSNGWCKQWGVRQGNGTYSHIQVTLYKNYKDTNYMIYGNSIYWSSENNGWYTGNGTVAQAAMTDIIGSPSNTGNKAVGSFMLPSASNHSWITEGFLAVGEY